MGHLAIPSDISIIGIKQETAQGTEAGGNYRQLLVQNFVSKLVPGRPPFKVAAGFKGAYGKSQPMTHREVSFTTFAGSSDANQATLLDLIFMAMDLDTVTGANPYTHTMDQENAVIAKKSWSIHHDDGRSNYSVDLGFVLNTMKITLDKTADPALIMIEVTGFSWKQEDDTVKTVNKAANYNYWSPTTAKLMRGATQVDNFTSIVIDINCLSRVFGGLNESPNPVNIDGQGLDLLVTLTGEWNEAANQVSDALRTAFQAGTTQTDSMIISFGPTTASDSFTLTIPHWEIQDMDNKDIEVDSMLPQSLVVYPTWEGDITNKGWKIEVKDAIVTNAGSL